MDKKEWDFFRNEIECLQKWKDRPHPNLLQMYHYFEDPKRLLLVTDICEGGEVFDKLSNEPNKKFETFKAGYIIK